MCTATAVMIGVGAAGAIGGAEISSHATASAAATQKASSDAALAYAKTQDAYKTATEANRYAAMTSAMSPFVSSGGSAAAAQAKLLGLPAPTAGPAVAPPPQYGTQPIPGMPANVPPNTAIPTGGTPSLAQQGVVSGGTPMPPPASATGATGSTASGSTGGTMVTMRSPDGTITQQVPASAVSHYQSLGATVVGR